MRDSFYIVQEINKRIYELAYLDEEMYSTQCSNVCRGRPFILVIMPFVCSVILNKSSC